MQFPQAFRPNPIQVRDIGIALIVGLIFAVLSAWVISPHRFFTQDPEPYLAPNFGDYCEVLGLWDVQDVPQSRFGETSAGTIDFLHPGRRTMSASVPAKLFIGTLGMIDGLAAGALLGSLLLGASLYLWGTALAGRFAGVFAVAAALAIGDLSLLSRHFTFYPAIISSFAATAALTAVTARARNSRGIWFLVAGTAIGFSLLVDVRGIIWVGFCIPLLVLAAWMTTGWRRKALGMGLLFLPLWASYQMGEWNTGRLLPMSLEEQVDVRKLAYTQGATGPEFAPPYSYVDGFSWGNSSLVKLPKTIRFLADQIQMELPEELRDARRGETRIYERRVRLWETISMVGLVVVVLGLRKDRWGLVILAVTGAPYVLAQIGIHTHHEFRVRFLLQTLPFTALILGVATSYGLALLLRGVGFLGAGAPSAIQARVQMQRPRRAMLWNGSGSVVVIFMVLNSAGWVPGFLSPAASWRGPPWNFGESHLADLREIIGDPQMKEMRMKRLLKGDPWSVKGDTWSNPDGMSKRWIFRNQTCIPRLLSTSKPIDQLFTTTFYRQ